MLGKTGRSLLMFGVVAQLSMVAPVAGAADAQRWGDHRGDWQAPRGGRDWDRHNWERQRRRDAKTDGVVAGVVGTAVVAGVIAAIASSNKDRKKRDRAEYCRDRYGNYDSSTDGYRASDGRIYPCD